MMIQGSIPYVAATRAVETVHRLAAALRAHSPTTLDQDASTLRFTAGGFRWVTRGNLLSSFDRGEIEVDPAVGRVRYRLDVDQFLALALLQLAFLMLVTAAIARATGDLWGLLIAPILVLAVNAANLATNLWRWRGFLRATLVRTSDGRLRGGFPD